MKISKSNKIQKIIIKQIPNQNFPKPLYNYSEKLVDSLGNKINNKKIISIISNKKSYSKTNN